MVRNRWPRIIATILIVILAVVSVVFLFRYLNIKPKSVNKTGTVSSDLEVGGSYYIDVYSDVLLRYDGYINAGGGHLLVADTKVSVLEDTIGPMTKIKSSDGLEGFVPDDCLRKEGTASLRSKTNRVVSAKNTIYFIESASSVAVYNGADRDNVGKYAVIGYLPARSSVRIIEKIGDKYGKIVDNCTGLVGYIDISGDALSEKLIKIPEQGKDYLGKEFADKIEKGTLTVVNTSNAIPYLKEASVSSDVQWMMKPGTWVRVLDVGKEYVHVKCELGEQIEGYIKTEYLYDTSGK